MGTQKWENHRNRLSVIWIDDRILVANPDQKLEAAAAAVCVMGLAGEIGWSHMLEFEGNSTYRNRIIDAIYHMDKETLDKGANYEVR